MAPELSPGGVGAQPGQQLVADVLFHTHRSGGQCLKREQERKILPGVDAEDVGPAVEVRQGELDLPIEPAGPHQGGVQGGHQHLQGEMNEPSLARKTIF